MAKKRRKIDKIRAKKKLAKAVNKTRTKKSNSLKTATKEVEKFEFDQDKIANLFSYNPQLINQDLKKTLLVSLVVLVVLALITLSYT
jgi:hypothetical protein